MASAISGVAGKPYRIMFVYLNHKDEVHRYVVTPVEGSLRYEKTEWLDRAAWIFDGYVLRKDGERYDQDEVNFWSNPRVRSFALERILSRAAS